MERDALWRAIMDNPEDDEPRLVFADWLLERGEPLGEFIMLQMRVDFAKDREATERYHELWHAHHRRWNAELGLPADLQISYERGLPSLIRIAMSADMLDVVDRAPIRWVRLWGCDPATTPLAAMRAIANDPRLARLHAISTYGGVECLRVLLASPHLRVKRFVVEPNECTNDAARALVEMPPQHLERLGFSGNRSSLDDDGIAILARASLPALRHLSLSSLPIGAEAMRHVANGTFTQLESFSVNTERGLAGAGVAALAASRNFAQLRSLDLARCAVGGGDFVVLAASDAFPELRRLDLGLGRITDEGLLAFASSNGMPRLESLDLSYSQLTPPAVAAFARAPRLASLHTLSLRAAGRGPEMAIAIADSPHAANLRELDLSEHKSRDAAAFALAKSPHLEKLERLVFYRNKVTHAGRAALQERFGDRVRID
jgi:uncharacterized protein (TIGR02996 family)